MSIELKSGSISDFFSSAKQTAKEIDEKKPVTRKNTIWVDPIDLMSILKPARTNLVRYLRKKEKVIFSELMKDMKRTPNSLNNDLKLLAKYQLVNIYKQPNPGHGTHKVIEANFKNERIRFMAEI